MTNAYINAEPSILVAIDISKERHDILIEFPDKIKRKRMIIRNIQEDYDLLINYLHAFNTKVIVGFEATGNYHRCLAWRLLTEKFHLKLISSVALARTREALHNSWDKNDPKDAQVILYMLKVGITQHYHDPLQGNILHLQELSKTHEVISKSKTEAWHRILTHYLPLYFPEAARFQGKSRSTWFINFLYHFPTPTSITHFSKEDFIKEAWPIVGRKVSKQNLLGDIYETAKASIGLPLAIDSPAILMFKLVLQEALHLIKQRQIIENQAESLLKENKDYQLLKQVPGIGPIHALTILAEAGDLRRFAHHRQFLKYCGLDLATYQSGLFKGQTKLSKYGNARLRRTFWMASQTAILKVDNSFRDKFERYIARDRDNRDLRRKAYTAVTAKMARTVHAIIKNKTDYRPFYIQGSDTRRKDPSL
ncbi:MAG: IS110 family transposase [Caedibacter sp. 37-49]|nr:MAG: IS110 family transposase [Caedibacter sp. 37-49]